MTSSPIVILGAGAWGAALAMHLARKGVQVRLWDHSRTRLETLAQTRSCFEQAFADSLQIVTQLEEALAGVQDVGLLVPSHAFRAVLTQIKGLLGAEARIFWGTKGLDPSGAFLHSLVAEIFSAETPAAVLSGPSFAREVALGMPTAISLAGNNAVFNQALQARFASDTFRLVLATDWIGVQLCGVVKNVMAIATGIVDGHSASTNTRCALITQALSEMGDLIVALGGQRDAVMSLAGVGDLILTATDNQSRNRRFGLVIGKGANVEAALKEIGESVEGYYNAKQLHALATQHQVAMPIARQVYEILYEDAPSTQLFQKALN